MRQQWQLVGRIPADLRTHGQTTPLTDIEIAVAAAAAGAAVWTHDSDFGRFDPVMDGFSRFFPT